MALIYPRKCDKSNPLEKRRFLLGTIFGDLFGVNFSLGPLGGLIWGPLRSLLGSTFGVLPGGKFGGVFWGLLRSPLVGLLGRELV